MEPQEAEKKVLIDEKSSTLTHRSRMPPPKKSNKALIVGIVVIVLLIVGVVIFLLLRGRSSDQSSELGKEKGGTSKASPTPTPSLYQLVTIEISEQQASLSAIENDIKELESVFKYQPVKFSDVLTPTPPQTPEWEVQKKEIVRARADLEIIRRIAVLNKLIPKINSTKKTSSLQKSVLIDEVNAHTNYLTSLKQTVEKENSFSGLVALANVITSDSYKSYQVLVPKINIVVISDKINVLNDSFSNVSNKLIQKTEKLRSSKKDVVSVQKTLAHLLFLMGDAGNKAELAFVRVFPLVSQDYPKNRSVLTDAKGKLQKARQNLKQAVVDEQKLVSSLRDIESGKSSQFNLFQLFNP